MPWAEVPPIGGSFEIGGQRLTRVVTQMPQTRRPSTQRNGVVVPNVTRRAGMTRPQYRDPKGHAAFSSEAKLADYAARNGMEVMSDGPDRCQQVEQQTHRFERERANEERQTEAYARSLSAMLQGDIE